MKIQLGAFEDTWGTLTLANGRIVYEGDESHLRAFVESLRQPGMDDETLLASLPQRLHSPYAWAVDLDAPAPLPSPVPLPRPEGDAELERLKDQHARGERLWAQLAKEQIDAQDDEEPTSDDEAFDRAWASITDEDIEASMKEDETAE